MYPRKIHPANLAAVLVAGLALAMPATPAAFAGPAEEEALLLAPAADAGHGSADLEDPVARKKKKEEKGENGNDKGGNGSKGGPGGKGKVKPFAEVIKEFTAHEGLFTLYTKDEKAYLEIKPDQYDKTYIMTISQVGGIGSGWLPFLGNQQLYNAPIKIQKVGKNVQFLLENVWYRADKDKQMQNAVRRSFSDSLFASTQLASKPHKERESDLVDVSEILLRDSVGIGSFTAQVMKSPYKFDKKNSYLGARKAFPENVEIEAVLHFMNPAPKVPMPTLPDSRSMFLRWNYSFSSVQQDDDFVPRIADDRVGHFVAPYGDFSTDETESPYVRYLHRWNLQKADPLLEVSTVKDPITFYLDHSVPKKYHAAITEGITLWNDAFEKIGLEDAIVVKEAPADPEFDSSDVRHSTIRWFVTTTGSFAIGPSHSNPFTGQIYDADIGFSERMMRGVRNRYRQEVSPLAMFNAAAEEARETARNGWSPESMQLGPRGMNMDPVAQCGIGSQLAQRAAFGYSLLTARGMKKGSVDENAYIRDFLISVTAHEVGHTLGLRHNYSASTIHDMNDIHDAAKTKKMGLTGSVMEYATVNIAPKGVTQGEHWQTSLGPYDYWAIEYAYKPLDAERPEDELDELAEIAERAAEPLLAYSTDQDAMGFSGAPIGMDPRSHQWDLGSDPIAYYTNRVKLARELWDSLPGEVAEEGEGYQIVRRAFNNGFFEYFPAVMSMTKYIGGVKHSRSHVGDPDGSLPYEPVSAEDQRRALDFLNTYLFGPDAFDLKPELVRALAADRFGPNSGSLYLSRLDYPIHDSVLAMQNFAMARIYHPFLLNRVVDMDTKLDSQDGIVEMTEIFGSLRDGIWSEVSGGGQPAINSYRRALQRTHLEYLVELSMKRIEMAPAEAVTCARYDLMQLQERVGNALSAGAADTPTKAHLSEAKAMIDNALEAAFIRGA
jgi:hypothetical protein